MSVFKFQVKIRRLVGKNGPETGDLAIIGTKSGGFTGVRCCLLEIVSRHPESGSLVEAVTCREIKMELVAAQILVDLVLVGNGVSQESREFPVLVWEISHPEILFKAPPFP